MRIMIDTSVWIECRENDELKNDILSASQKFEIRSSEVAEDELKKSYIFSKQKGIKLTEEWKLFYESIKRAVVKKRESAIKLPEEYYNEGRKVGLKADEMVADLLIVASASLDAVDFIFTLNRRTMASSLAQAVYKTVNEKNKLKTPQFITDIIAFRRIVYA